MILERVARPAVQFGTGPDGLDHFFGVLREWTVELINEASSLRDSLVPYVAVTSSLNLQRSQGGSFTPGT